MNSSEKARRLSTHPYSMPDASSSLDAHDREDSLRRWLEAHGSVLVGFSGGVDSAYLATVAVDTLGADRTLAVIGRSASYPAAQWIAARAVADQFAIPVLEVDTDELNDPRYAANPSNRCFYCKSELWGRLVPVARQRGLAVVVDGTNADDLGDHRPGAVAAREHGVLSPLALLGFTKRDIRFLSEQRGIPTWSQPASPCLSSRVPYGTAVTPERLLQVERAESAVRALRGGVSGDLRVRYHDEVARVELGVEELHEWLAPDAGAELRAAVTSAGFARVALDLRGFRSGSLNVLGGVSPDVAGEPRPLAAPGSRAIPVVRAHEPLPPVSGESRPGDASTTLRTMLASRGLHVTVEARGTLALLVPGSSGAAHLSPSERRAVVQLARSAGFTHVALELKRADDSRRFMDRA